MKKLVFFLAPIGATAFMAGLYGVYQTMALLAEMMVSQAEDVVEKRLQWLLIYTGIGTAGAALLGPGLVCILLDRHPAPRAALKTNLLAAMLFVAGAGLVALGNLQLCRAFSGLASAANLRPEQYLARVELGKWPLVAGGSCLVFAAIAALWEIRRVASASVEIKPRAAPIPTSGTGFFGMLATFILVLCCLWGLWGTIGLQRVATMEHLRPDELAQQISAVLLSMFGNAAAMAAFAMAFLLKALSPSITNAE